MPHTYRAEPYETMSSSQKLTSRGSAGLDTKMQTMATHRPTSWLNEIDHARPRNRAPSIPDLIPFELEASGVPKASRSLSFPASFGNGQHDPRPTFRQAHGFNNSSHGNFSYSPQNTSAGYAISTSPLNSHNIPRVPEEHEAFFSRPLVQQHQLPPIEDQDEEQEFRSIRELYSPPSTPHLGMLPLLRQPVYCVVAFKAWRAEVYLRDPLAQFAIDVAIGSNVIVEADRGQDIGQIMFTSTSLYKADRYARNLNLKHHRELVRSSFRFNQHWREIYLPPVTPSTAADPSRKIKIIKRHATSTDVLAMRAKEEVEARSKRTCEEMIQRHRLDMEVLEAEWQADYQRLTFFYFSPNYVVFNALVHDLFRMFKKRIWMSSVNATTAGRGGGLASFDPTQGGFMQSSAAQGQH